MPRLVRHIAIVAVVLLAAAACSGSDRPDAASWVPTWDALVEVIPDHSDLGDPPDSSICQSTLGELRTKTDEVLPSPSATVDDLVTEWAAVAESAFFDCPPAGEEIGSFDEAYSEMQRIEESVRSALTQS